MGVTKYLAEKTKRLVAEEGILSMPAPREGKKLNPETLKLIEDFYESDEVSRAMPGLRDFKSYAVNSEQTTVCRKY